MATPTTLPSSFTSGQVLTAAQMNNLRGAFRILQISVVQLPGTFTTTSTTYTDLTGLSTSITPSSTSSNILIGYAVQATGLDAVNMGAIQIVRNSTAIGNATAAGNRVVGNAVVAETTQYSTSHATNWFLDSPATTSATTYKLQIRTLAPGTIVVNRTQNDTDSGNFGRGTSSLVVCEVSA